MGIVSLKDNFEIQTLKEQKCCKGKFL